MGRSGLHLAALVRRYVLTSRNRRRKLGELGPEGLWVGVTGLWRFASDGSGMAR